MNKKIPFQFDCVILSSDEKILKTSEKIRRLKVGVFTKYSNRNGSYITDAFAEKLIETAPSCPVVGFFDPEKGDWAGHLGPTLVSAYGYVDQFLGWENFVDSDGVAREYAVFSIVAFSDYFEEAQYIVGKHQSMEIDPESIKGEWGLIGDEEYFIYSDGKMKGFCILGDNIEPCFSASAFFSADTQTQFEKFSSLLMNLKAQVEEGEKTIEGGEQPMENYEEQVLQPEEEIVEEEKPVESTATVVAQEQLELDFTASEQETETEEISEYEQQIATLRDDLSACSQRIAELEGRLTEANAVIARYQAEETVRENERKNVLIQSYEEQISTEELEEITSNASSFSYEELEAKLAVTFARKNLQKKAEKVFVAEPELTGFAALIEKYKKN